MDRLLDAISAVAVTPSPAPDPSAASTASAAPVAEPAAARLFVCVGKHCRAAGAGRDLAEVAGQRDSQHQTDPPRCGDEDA